MKYDMIRQLEGVSHGQRQQLAQQIADTLGISMATVWREFRRINGLQRKRRAPARQEEVIDERWIDAILALKAKGKRLGTAAREISTERAIALLEEMGTIPAGALAASTANRALKAKGFRDHKPVQRYEANFVNQSHQMDFSRSEYFDIVEFDHYRQDYVLMVNARGGMYKNKDHKKLRLWLATILDEFSRARLVRYYAAAGESALLGLQFLQFAWGRGEDDHPMRYVPDVLRTDNGSFAKAAETQAMLKALGIKWQPSSPGNSKSMGKVERSWQTLWRGFELETALRCGEKGTIYLAELNALVHAEMIRVLEKEHPRKDTQIGTAYTTGLRKHPPRTVDIDTLQVACRVLERHVAMDCTVSISGEYFRAPEKFIGQRIKVYRNLQGAHIGESMEGVKPERFTLEPFEPNRFNEYSAFPDTAEEIGAKSFDNSELPARLRALGPGSTQASAPRALVLPHAEQEIDVDSPFSDHVAAFNSRPEAQAYIGRRLGCSYAEVAAYFDELLDATLDRDLIDSVVTQALAARKTG